MNWGDWIQDRVNDLLTLVERAVVALERIADASEENVKQ